MVRYTPQRIGIVGVSLERGHRILNEYIIDIPAEMVLKFYRYRNGTRVLFADGGFIETLPRNIENIENWRGRKYTSIIIDREIDTDYKLKLIDSLKPLLLPQIIYAGLDEDI